MRSDRQPALPLPDAVMAQHYRTAADSALHNPFFTPEQQRERHRHYTAEAEKLARPTSQPAEEATAP